MIKKILLTFLVLLVLAWIALFSFTAYVIQLASNYGMDGFLQDVVDVKTKIEQFITGENPLESLQQTKEKALELKQNVSSGIIETQNKIDEIRTSVDATQKALQTTASGVQQTMSGISELQKSATDVIPTSLTGALDSKAKIEKLRKDFEATSSGLSQTMSGVNATVEVVNKIKN